MTTVYNKKCLNCGLTNIHEYLNECPICKSNNLFQDLELKNKDNSIKRNKGKSIIDLPCNYTIIDIETTGLMPQCDEIIELSALKIRNNKIVDKFTSLIKPDDKIDGFITKLTGITNDMLKNAPKIKNIITQFIDFISNDIVVGYNVNFDINFIYDDYKGFKNKDFSNNYIDIMRICKKACELPNYKLKTVASYYNIPIDGHHRGLNDCYITYNVFNTLASDILSKYKNIKDFYNKNWCCKSSAKNITTNLNADDTNFFYKKTCVFTGTLNIPRKEAMQLTADMGGFISDTLNKETNILIVGTQDYTKTKQDGKSNKMLKAEKYILKGQDLQIIPESEFYNLINEYKNNEENINNLKCQSVILSD